MKFPPDVFLIGAQKSGTTTLADLLDQHPRINLCEPKEPNFFGQHYEKGFDWYRPMFTGASDDALLLDASVSYSARPVDPANLGGKHDPTFGRDIPKLISEHQPTARIIYILRSPIERTYSAYLHRKRFQGETRSLVDAMAAVPNLIDTSRYLFQAGHFMKYFPRDQMLFLNFADLANDPLAVARRCFDFLDVASVDFSIRFDQPKNQAFEYNAIGGSIRKILGSQQNMHWLSGMVQFLMPNAAHKYIKRIISRDAETISESDYNLLSAHFEEDERGSKELFGFVP